MAVSLGSAPVAFLAARTAASDELSHCWQAVLARYGEPVLVVPERGPHANQPPPGAADMGPAEVRLAAASPADFAGLVLVSGPDPAAGFGSTMTLAFISRFFELGLPVAACCRAGLDLARAGLLRGRTVTSAPSLRPQLAAAGACWVDSTVEHCAEGPNSLVTSSSSAGLPAFCDMFTRIFAAARLADLAAARPGR
jgi:protease I